MKGTLFYFLIKIFLARINNDKKKCHFKRAKLDGFKFTNIVERQNSKLSQMDSKGLSQEHTFHFKF